jgi:hypothetical protein
MNCINFPLVKSYLEMLTDEIALKTNWNPIHYKGASFKTIQLKKIDNRRIDFVQTKGSLIFVSLFFAIGLTIVAIILLKGLTKDLQTIAIFILGLCFLLISGGHLFFGKNSLSFRSSNGTLSLIKRSLVSSTTINLKSPKKLSALQVLEKTVRTNKTTFQCYELNLIFEDTSRENILNYGGKNQYESIINDASTLGDFLSIPVWDNVKK